MLLVSDLPFYLAAFGILLGVLVVFHELGHYLAARLCGVKVLRFSVGFGRILWRKRLGVDRTEWAISLFPLGGYVKMLDEAEGKVAPKDLPRAFNRQSVGKRSFIVAAGPLANFALAIMLYWGIFMVGGEELRPVLGTPPAETPAFMANIQNGELVRKIDGQTVQTWDEFRWLLLQKAVDQESVELEVINRNDEISVRQLYLAAAGEKGWEGDAMQRLGIGFFRPDMPPLVGKILPGSPGERAGLLSGDRIATIDGREIATWYDFVSIVRESAGRSLSLGIERDGQIVTVDVVPEGNSERGRIVGKIGVGVAENPQARQDLKVFVRHGFFAAGRKAISETWDKSIFSLVMMGKMLTGEVSWKNLSGPVSIADYAGQSAKLGFDYYVKFMALLSVSLGVLNLLPIPVLDGGHLMYHIFEVVRGRPLSERAMQIGQRIGLSFLFVLMAFAFFNDLNRLFNG